MTRQRALLIVLAALIPAAFLAGRFAQPAGDAARPGERKILYYVDPMNPAFRSPEPGIAPCGMPLEPVYADGPQPGAGKVGVPGSVPVDADQLQLIGVAREQVRRRTVRQTLRLLGTVVADETRLYTISAASAGRALQMGTATTGSLVARGQVLGAYYSQELIVPQQNFLRLRETTDELRRTGVNPFDNLQGGTQMATYERNLLFARQTLQNLGMSPEQIEEISSKREVSYMVQIRAPAAGIVLSRKLTLGQSFDAGDELFTIADLERVWISADALQGEERLFTPGMRAAVTVPGTGQTLPATVSRVLPQFAAETRTLKIRLEARNPGFVLRPDMFVDVEFPVEAGPGLFLPKEAVLDSGTRQAVFVEQAPGVFTPRAVRTGRRFADQVEIVAGLMEGEKVVTSGNFLLDSESRMRAAGGSAAAAIDPICGMEVDEAKARAKGLVSEHGGRTWFFCAETCKRTFDRDPAAAAGALDARLPETRDLRPSEKDPERPSAPPAPAKAERAVPPAPRVAPPAKVSGAGPPAETPADDEGDPKGYTPDSLPGGLPGLGRDQGPERGPAGWQTPLPVPRDPVCGMEVNIAKATAAGLVSRYRAETFHFCTEVCKKEFDANPAMFVQTSR